MLYSLHPAINAVTGRRVYVKFFVDLWVVVL